MKTACSRLVLSAFLCCIVAAQKQVEVRITDEYGVTWKGTAHLTPDLPPVDITSQIPIIVDEQTVVRFTAPEPAKWSLASGSIGTITETGIYQAPAIVVAHRQNGCMMLPLDHVYHARVDGLSVHPKSAEYMAYQPATAEVFFSNADFPLIATDADPPATVFPMLRYTPGMNGSLMWWHPPAQPWQGGRYRASPPGDRHVLTVSAKTCEAQEVYNWYDYQPPELAVRQCGTGATADTCVAASAAKYNTLTQSLPNSPENPGFTDATGTFMAATFLTPEELERALDEPEYEIPHMVGFAQSNTYNASSHVWPGVAHASPGTGTGRMPYGTVLRLKKSYTYTGSDPLHAKIVKALQRHGMILADGTQRGYEMRLQSGYTLSAHIRQSLTDFEKLNIGRDFFEVVDMSPLMLSPSSGLVRSTDSVPPGYVEVVAKGASKEYRRRITLRGVTVGVPHVREYVQAGSPAFKVPAWTNGTSDSRLTYSMTDASDAKIDSSGMMTPPTNLQTPLMTTVTITSAAKPSARATVTYVFLPPLMRFSGFSGTGAYVDAAGNAWWSSMMYRGRKEWVPPLDTAFRNAANWNQNYWQDYRLYRDAIYSHHDIRGRVRVKNGAYKITLKLAEVQNCVTASGIYAGPCTMHVEVQGARHYSDLDVSLMAGGNFRPLDLEMNTTVTDGILQWTIYGVRSPSAQVKISAMQIERVESAPTKVTRRKRWWWKF